MIHETVTIDGEQYNIEEDSQYPGKYWVRYPSGGGLSINGTYGLHGFKSITGAIAALHDHLNGDADAS